MTFKSAIWHPIAVGLSVLNFAGLGFAVASAEPWHATLHGVLALASGVWAKRLRERRGQTEVPVGLEALENLEAEVSSLRQELSEAQERLDFAERLLAQRAESRRVGPES
jgi:hypothetical protein